VPFAHTRSTRRNRRGPVGYRVAKAALNRPLRVAYDVDVEGVNNVPAGEGVTEDEVLAFARRHLAGYKVPRHVTFVAELPKTGSGKVLKRQLRDEFLATRAGA